MKSIFRRALKLLAYLTAMVVILLAIAVGLFRLFLPRLPEYQDEIKEWASTAIGMQVEFSGMDARWGLGGPELEFYDAELIRRDSGVRIVATEEVSIGLALTRLIVDQALVIDRVAIRSTSVEVEEMPDGSFRVQGIPADDLLSGYTGRSDDAAAIELVGEDIELRLMQPDDEQPHIFQIPNIRVSLDKKRVAADADIRLPADLGRQLDVAAIQMLTVPAAERSWDINVDAEDISLPGWSGLLSGDQRLLSGVGDLDVALAVVDGRISSATADASFVDVALVDQGFFDVSGRVEVAISTDGWLVAANKLTVAHAGHVWPESFLRIEASIDASDRIIMLDTQASYFHLDDLSLLRPWLSEEHRETLANFNPSGVVRNLAATVSELGSDEPRFNISAELDRVGIADAGSRPGIRGFSGLLRANRAGGRLEINSTDFAVLAPEYVDSAIAVDTADGTVIWRNSNARTTVLSDSISVQSEFFDSQSNVQLVLYRDGRSPEIDLASSWSISEVGEAKRYIPRKGLKPKLYEWFQMALVNGAITRGTTVLNGPLDKFPFDGDEGNFRIEASVRNLTFKYHAAWPATEQSDMEVVLDKARLYSIKNRSVSAGNLMVDAKVNIADLRDPVLKIESFSTGTLETIRQFSMQSPISDVFGGQLDRVAVSGDASFTLDLTVPLKRERVQEFEFVTRIRSNNGTLAIAGFDPPVTDLIGEVTIERENIASESLGGSFLGESIDIALDRSEDPRFTVVATVDGAVADAGITDGLGVPLQGLIRGRTDYQARILFPSGKVAEPAPLTIEIDTALEGMALDLPAPAGKSLDSRLPLSGDIRFVPGGEIIESGGVAEDRLAWQVAFKRPEGRWDFDRGVVALGAEEVSALADVRGLHIRGTTPVVRLEDWLNVSRSGEKNVGAADRLRSIDLAIDDLYLVGQHLQGHRVKVDRSASDWLVQFDGDDIVGSVFVPYDFGGNREMVLDMEKLRLPGDESAAPSDAELDPTILPPISLRAAEFAFGDRYLGAVEATIEKMPNGLNATVITSKDATFGITASGRWVKDPLDTLGSHTHVTATLTSTDVERTMTRLNYQPGIVSKNMNMNLELDWSGGPRADFFDVLNGSVEVRIENGQLEEVEPGAGRMFGLMSIVALPRRLSLDFRDVFAKGFGFDKIAGTFRIDAGKTYTCDLSLEGPAADIGIVGEVDLTARTYDQTAIVSANVGNTLPLVGAVVAGPQVAAALLIFSQIFKKPLQEVGQAYYAIGGSWDEPSVESVNTEAFVASGKLAGCLATAEQG